MAPIRYAVVIGSKVTVENFVLFLLIIISNIPDFTVADENFGPTFLAESTSGRVASVSVNLDFSNESTDVTGSMSLHVSSCLHITTVYNTMNSTAEFSGLPLTFEARVNLQVVTVA